MEIGPELRQWVSGLGSLDLSLTPAERAIWQAAVDVFFDDTQRRVHVLSGDLKSSGRVREVHLGAGLLGGEVVYGGTIESQGLVDYAQYEFRRGGSHDPFAGAMGRYDRMFRDRMAEMMVEVVRRATGG